MAKKTYLPGFAQLLHKAGKYAYKHKVTLNAVIDGSEKLTNEEKKIAKKAIEDVLAAHEVLRKSGTCMQILGSKEIGFLE